jgi:hypothetical protein
LSEYYFDIETVPLEEYRHQNGASFDPSHAKIISIQYQRLHPLTGQPLNDLQILKEWETGSSEKLIVELFKKLFVDGGIWQFIPVGNNLVFECRFLKHKLKQYCNVEGLKLGHRPMIDLKHVMVIANNGFKGYHRLLGKSGVAGNIEEWYYNRNWEAIEHYITNEAKDFVKAFALLKRELPKIMVV